MSEVNLELQLKFLEDLDRALAEALVANAMDGDEKLEELRYMKQEVIRARDVVSRRIVPQQPLRAGRQTSRDQVFNAVHF